MAKRTVSAQKIVRNTRSVVKPQEQKSDEIKTESARGFQHKFLLLKEKSKILTNMKPSSYNPLLVVLLIIASFLLGMLYTKVQYLEKNQTNIQVQGNADVDSEANNNQLQPGKKVNVGVGIFPAQGDKNAKVKIVEFADLRCPYCEQFYKETVPQIINDFVKTGKASFYFRNFAFLGPASIVASNATECANEQGKFWEMHDYLFQNQPEESDTTMYNTDTLTQAAGTLGINSDQFRTCLSTNKYQKNVDKDIADGQEAGVSGTPTLFVNGIPIVGAEPYTSIKPIIEAAIAGK